MIVGNDGGIAVSRDRGVTWAFAGNIPVRSSTMFALIMTILTIFMAVFRTTVRGVGRAKSGKVVAFAIITGSWLALAMGLIRPLIRKTLRPATR